MQGLHLTADLYGCACPHNLMTDAATLQALCVTAVRASGLTWVADKFHDFSAPGHTGAGVTGMVLLAESHVAIHTWPERAGVTLDVYVCNYSVDNSTKARILFDALKKAFDGKDQDLHTLWRGKSDVAAPQMPQPEGASRVLTEWLNPNSGYSIRAGRLIEEGHSRFQHYEVWDTPQLGKLFRLDGAFMTSERDEFIYHENLIHIAALSHPSPERVLVIGGGDGGSSEELLKHPSIREVVLVELDDKVVDIAKKHLGGVHHGAFDNPRLTLLLRDGMEYLRTTKEKFDLIVLDLTDPHGPSEALYTQDFYRLCKQALANGGALTLHIGAPFYQPHVFARNVANLQAVFKVVAPYAMHIPLYGAYWGMACASESLDPRACSSTVLGERLQSRALKDLRFYTPATHHAVFALPQYVNVLLTTS